MKKMLLVFCCFITFHSLYAQKVSREDSVYIYKHFIFYDAQNNTYGDIDEPSIEEFWLEDSTQLEKYYEKAAHLTSIPVVQRIILASYLPASKKQRTYKWVYDNLKTANDTTSFYCILDSGYGMSYDSLGIELKQVLKYYPEYFKDEK